ncbi:hypothetical protein JVU11DRAFT_3063 [Chiua virens]|nr:hypothetical protein JVU11DRAFT_3063 [Chiua virens]
MESFQLDTRLFIRQLVAVAGQSLLVYDYFLTFNYELSYIWDARWTVVKAIFLFNRYGTLVGQSLYTLQQLDLFSTSSPKFCLYFQWYVAFFGILSGESIRILVILRAWAIWGCTYRVVVALTCVYVLYLAVCIGLALLTMVMTLTQPLGLLVMEGTGVCTPRGAPKTWIVPLAGLSLDAFTFVMVAYPLAKRFKATRFRHSPIYRVLSRDAFLFFFISIVTGMLTIVCQTVFVDDPRAQMSMGLGLPLLTVTGQRVVLNLRSLRSQPQSELIVHSSSERRTNTVPSGRDQRWHGTNNPASSHHIEFTHDNLTSFIELSDMKRL